MRSEIINALYVCIAAGESFILSFYFKRFLGRKYSEKWVYVLAYSVYFLTNFVMSAVWANMEMKSALTVVFPLLSASLLYLGKLRQRLIAATLIICYAFVSEVLVMAVMSWVNAYAFPVRPREDIMYFIGAGAVTLIYFLITIIIVSKNKPQFLLISLRHSAIILSMIVLCVFIAYIELMFGVYTSRTTTLLHVLSVIALCAIAVLLYYVFENFQKSAVEQKHLGMVETQLAQMSKQFEMMETHRTELRTIRHDFINHLYLIQQMADKGELQALSEYIGKYTQETNKLTIEGVTGVLSIDAIIAIKRSTAEKQHTRFTILSSKLSEVHINPVHMNIVLCNALDNALEACSRLPEDMERYIVMGLKTEGGFLYVRVANPYMADKTKGELSTLTLKPDGEFHGLGLESIRNTVNKYGGIFEFEAGESEVVVRLRMKNDPLPGL